MKNYFLFLLLLSSGFLYSQTELTNDNIKISDEYQSEIQQSGIYTPFKRQESLLYPYSKIIPPSVDKRVKNIPFELPPDLYYLGPPLQHRYSTSFPFENDYNYNGIIGLSDRTWISGGSLRQTYPTYGTIQSATAIINHRLSDRLIVSGGSTINKYALHDNQYNDVRLNANVHFILRRNMSIDMYGNSSVSRYDHGIGSLIGTRFPEDFSRSPHSYLNATQNYGLNYNYSPLDWLSVSGGPYGSRYEFFDTKYNDYGIRGNLNIQAHERIKFNLYGKHSLKGNINDIGPNGMMHPHDYYGGNVEFKISDRVGIVTGVERELNPFTGKWDTKPYVYPVFY